VHLQRLHAHEPHPPVVGQLHHERPPRWVLGHQARSSHQGGRSLISGTSRSTRLPSATANGGRKPPAQRASPEDDQEHPAETSCTRGAAQRQRSVWCHIRERQVGGSWRTCEYLSSWCVEGGRNQPGGSRARRQRGGRPRGCRHPRGRRHTRIDGVGQNRAARPPGRRFPIHRQLPGQHLTHHLRCCVAFAVRPTQGMGVLNVPEAPPQVDRDRSRGRRGGARRRDSRGPRRRLDQMRALGGG